MHRVRPAPDGTAPQRVCPQRPGLGAKRRPAWGRSRTPGLQASRGAGPGGSPAWPVRRAAHPRRALSPGGTGPDPTPWGGCTAPRPPGLMEAPGWGRRSRGQGVAPRWRARAGPPDWRATSARPPPRRPTAARTGHSWSPRCPSPRDAAAGGHALLPAGAAREGLDGIAQHQAQERAEPWERPAQRRCAAAPLPLAAQRVVVGTQRAIPVEALVDGRRGHPRRHPVPVRRVGERRADLGPVRRARRLVQRGPERGTWGPPRPPAAQSPRGPHRRGRDRRVGPQAPTAHHRPRRGVDRLGLSVPPGPGAESGAPVPGADAFDADDASRPVGGHGVEPWVGCRLQRPVRKARTRRRQEAAIPASGVAIEATSTLVRLGVEAPEVAASCVDSCPHASRPRVGCRGGGSPPA